MSDLQCHSMLQAFPKVIFAHGYAALVLTRFQAVVLACFFMPAELLCYITSSPIYYSAVNVTGMIQVLFLFFVFALQVPYPFWAPTGLKTPTQDYKFEELPKTSEPTVLINSAGFIYEINAVRSAILQGNLFVDSKCVISSNVDIPLCYAHCTIAYMQERS